MEFKYGITVDDYVAFSCHIYGRSIRRKITLVLCLGCALVSFAVSIGDLFAFGPALPQLYCVTLGVILIGLPAVLGQLIYPLLNGIHYWSIGLRRELVILVLTDESLTAITEKMKFEVKWNDIERVDEIADYTFIMLTRASVIILPRRGFDSEEDYFKVRDFAKSHEDGGRGSIE